MSSRGIPTEMERTLSRVYASVAWDLAWVQADYRRRRAAWLASPDDRVLCAQLSESRGARRAVWSIARSLLLSGRALRPYDRRGAWAAARGAWREARREFRAQSGGAR